MRHILESNFPFGTTEHSPEYLTDNLVVSEEGFKEHFNKIFKRKKEAATKEDAAKYSWQQQEADFQWISDNILKGDPTKLTFKEDSTVKLGPRHAPFFYRGNVQVTDVVKEATKDLSLYQGIFNRYKGPIKRNNQKLNEIDREAQAFLKRDTYPEGQEEFKGLLKKWETYITPLNENFREPNTKLLGFDQPTFLDENDFFTDRAIVVGPDSVTLPAVTATTVKPLVEVIGKLYALQVQVDEIEDGGLGLDLSDPPFRGYYRELDDVMAKMKLLYLHPTYEAVSLDLLNHLLGCLEQLARALVSYIRNSVKD